MFMCSPKAESKSPNLCHPSPLLWCHDTHIWQGHNVFFSCGFALSQPSPKKRCHHQNPSLPVGFWSQEILQGNAHLRKHLIPEPLPWQSRHTSRRPSCNSELLYLSFPITHFNGGLTAVPLAEFSSHVLLSTQTVGEVTTYIRPHKPSSFFICQAFPLYLYKGWWLVYNLWLLSSF